MTPAERYRALLETGRTLSATLSAEELYAAIYRETARALDASGFYIALYDQSRDLARIVYYADEGEVRRVDVSYRGSDSEVLSTQRASLVSDDLAARSLLVLGEKKSPMPRSAISAPMIHNGRLLGAISTQSREPGVYAEDDLALLQGIADIAAVALDNALQFEELSRRRREAEQIEAIGRALTSELDPQEVLGKVIAAVLEVLDVDGAAVWLCEGRDGSMARVANAGGEISLPLGLHWKLEGELAEALLQQRRPYVLDDLATNDLLPAHVREHLTGGSAVGVPLAVAGGVAGILTAGSRQPRHFSPDDVGVLQRLASQGSIALENARLHETLHALSLTDPLTGLPNRRRLQIYLESEVAAARRGRPLALAIFDIDHFKHYNDTFGHVAGDDILKALAHILIDENRAMNLVARYGGDEFVAAMSESNVEGARHFVERVVARVERDEAMSQFGLTISVGVAEFDPDSMATMNDILRAADADMYQVKAERPRRAASR